MTYFPRQHYKRQGARQTAVCSLCGQWVDVQDLILADVQGLRGFYVCSSHPWEKMARVNPSFQDRGGVGQVMDPGHDFLPAPGGWLFLDPEEDNMTGVVKTADQTVTASTVLVNDSELSVSVLSNHSYIIIGSFFVSSSAVVSESFKCDLGGGNATASSFSAQMLYGNPGSNGSDHVTSLTSVMNGSGNTQHPVWNLFASIDASGSGSVTLRWAQTLAGGTTTVLAGSWLAAFRI